MAPDRRPLVLHVVHRFDVGGLENGVVNLINHMPRQAYRHAVLALTDVAESFASRIERDDVTTLALHKPPGQGFWLYPRVMRLLRQMRPAVVHTRNLAALEMVVPAFLAGVPVRIHGEHGRDVEDFDGSVRRYQWLRRAYRPFVGHYVALSRDLARYLHDKVGIDDDRVTQVYNGVDTVRFAPPTTQEPIAGCPFDPARHWLVGTVGRMQTVKDQLTLASAFVQALSRQPMLMDRLRLVMVGDGPLREQARSMLAAAGFDRLAWLPGERGDVPAIMKGLHCFALPSRAEGVSNTILEAMATGLPVLATGVGGNVELVEAGRTGVIVPAGDVDAMADALVALALDASQAQAMGRAGRSVVEARFSMQAMVATYQGLYDRLLQSHKPMAARCVLP